MAGCTCIGHVVTLHCTSVGEGETIWRGNALNQCPGKNITLYHSDDFKTQTGHCSNEVVVGKGLNTRYNCDQSNNKCYTSQLSIFITKQLNGTTVKCEHHDVMDEASKLIGGHTLIVTTGN